MNKHKLARATIINLSSRVGLGILSLLQVVLIAKVFGASETIDAYMVAIWIPLIIWGLGDTVLVYSLVPYLVSVQVKSGTNNAKEAADHIFSWFIFILLGISTGIYLFSPYLVYILVPGFSKNAQVLTAELLRYLSPAILIAGVAAFLSSILYTLKKFTVPAIAALFPDIGSIGFILYGIERWGIKGVVAGFLCGVSVQLIVLIFALLKSGILPVPRLTKFGEFITVSKLMGPRFGGVGLNRAIVGVDRFFASMLGVGSVSILVYSSRLAQLPVLMAVSAFGKTLMPALSKEVAQGNMEGVRRFIPKAIGFFLFGLAPFVFLLIYYSESIIKILYQRGAFTTEATSLAANVLVYYSLAIIFQSVSIIFLGMFFASGDTWTPFKITFFSLILNTILDYILINLFGITGIAISTVGVAIVSMVLLYNALIARIGKIEILPAFRSVIKIGVATGIMALSVWGLSRIMGHYHFYKNITGQFFEIGIFSLISWCIFLISCRFLKLEEYLTVELMLERKLRWQK